MSKPIDPVEDALHRVGVQLEKKTDVHPITQMLGGGLGGIAGGELGAFIGLGPLGKAVASLLGAVVGNIVVTYNVRIRRPDDERTDSPMAVSDRR